MECQAKKAFIFTHAPDDAFAPLLVHEMHERIRIALRELKPSFVFPSLPRLIESNSQDSPSKPPDRQLKFFDL
jgi:hypothetical protein